MLVTLCVCCIVSVCLAFTRLRLLANPHAPVKEVFKTLDFLGWYTTAPTIGQLHFDIQQQVFAHAVALTKR